MPTGYTSIIEEKEDVTFRDYLLRCARAFGACVMQREDPLDQAPKRRQVDSYITDGVASAKAELEQLEAMTPKQIKALYLAEVKQTEKDNAESAAKHERLSRRYRAMRKDAQAWEPPSKDHEGLKKFMIEQIDLCKSEWEGKPYVREIPPSAEEWHRKKIESAKWRLDWREKDLAKAIESAKESRIWLDALYASLDGASVRR